MAKNNNLTDLLSDIATSIKNVKGESGTTINAQNFSTEISKMNLRNEYGNDGTVDAEGLRELGWNENDIAWLQKVCWWDAEDNDKWKVTDANKAFGPNGATPITWQNYASYEGNTDIIYFPKLSNTVNNVNVFKSFPNMLAIPTDGWTYFATGRYDNGVFHKNMQLKSVGNLNDKLIYIDHIDEAFTYACNIRYKERFKPNFNHIHDNSLKQLFGARAGFVNFENIDLSNIDFSSISNIYGCFYTSSVITLTLGNFNIPSSVLADAFVFNSTHLENIYIDYIGRTFSFAKAFNITRESCIRIFNALDPNVSGTITLESSVKARLTDADKQIAIDKGWTIA